jgi:hypothetical protein
MIESYQSTNAWEIEAAGIKRSCGGPGSKSQGLGRSILLADKAGLASFIHGAEPLAGMEQGGGGRGRRPAQGWHGGRWWALNWDDGRPR